MAIGGPKRVALAIFIPTGITGHHFQHQVAQGIDQLDVGIGLKALWVILLGTSGGNIELLQLFRDRSEERRVGKSVSVRVDLGGRRIINKNNIHNSVTHTNNISIGNKQSTLKTNKRHIVTQPKTSNTEQ